MGVSKKYRTPPWIGHKFMTTCGAQRGWYAEIKLVRVKLGKDPKRSTALKLFSRHVLR